MQSDFITHLYVHVLQVLDWQVSNQVVPDLLIYSHKRQCNALELCGETEQGTSQQTVRADAQSQHGARLTAKKTTQTSQILP